MPTPAMMPMSAKQLAGAVKKELVNMTGLSPEFMYVLTDEPNEKDMTLNSHGWGSGAEAELVAEEAYAYIELAISDVTKKHPELDGCWDTVTSCVVAFYNH